MSKLEAFLRHHKVLTKFKCNVRSAKLYTFERLSGMADIQDAIDLAFIWINTPEDERFWYDLWKKAGGYR